MRLTELLKCDVINVDDLATAVKNNAKVTLNGRLRESLERALDGLKDKDTAVAKDYFTDYIKELCYDCGYLQKGFPWWIAIDWEKTAENCKVDYTEIELLGRTFYVY